MTAPPASAAPAAPATPTGSAVEAAVQAARERLSGTTPAPLAPTPASAPDVQPVAPTQPGAPAAPAGPPETPVLGGGQRAAAPGKPAPIDWSKVDWATFDTAAAEQNDPTLLFVPPRRPGQPPVPVKLDDPTLVEDLRRFRNEGMRGAEYAEAEAELAQREDALLDWQTRVQTDPAGFILDKLPAEQATQMAMMVLTHPEVWKHMKRPLADMLRDPRQLELNRAKLQNMRDRMASEARDAVDAARATRQNAKDVRKAIHALVPPGLTKAQQELWRDAARAAVKGHAQRNRLMTIDVRDVPAILAEHLSAYNVAPEEAWARLRTAFVGQQPPSAPAPAPVTATTPSSGLTPRQAAAMIAPSGAGAPAAQLPAPPPNQGIEERLEWLRQNPQALRRA